MSAVILRADARSLPLPDDSVDLIVTSPPYFGLRSYTDNVKCLKCIDMERDGRDPRQAWPDYDAHVRRDHVQHYDGQIGSEATPAQYVAALVECTREWVRVLKPSGSMFVNLGDKYNNSGGEQNKAQRGVHYSPKWEGHREPWTSSRSFRDMPHKTLLGMPWRYALACMDDLGLILRAEIIWAKPNGLPESVTDRVRRSHEQVFHFTRQPRYYSAVDEVREPHEHGGHGSTKTERMAAGQQVRGLMHNGAMGSDNRMAGNPLGKLPGSVWSIPSQPLTVPARLGTDHFAAFPMELPRRVIAGWSPPGICTACGEGRRPVVDKALGPFVGSGHLKPANSNGRLTSARAAAGIRHSQSLVGATQATITGYACACPQPDAPTRPSLVVDPFGGTGTTALVADALGRHGLSFDRSADYGRLAKWRTTDPGERAKAMQVPKPPLVMDGQDALFALEILDRP